MKILKLQTEGTGAIFYHVTSVNESTYTIKPLCRVREGFLTVKYKNANESHLYKSEVGVNYLEATRKELKRLKEMVPSKSNSKVFMSKYFIKTVFVLLILGSLGSCQVQRDNLGAVKGVLDLENHEIPPEKLLNLRGEWDYYENVFYRLGTYPEKKGFVNMPHTWEGDGYGTYHLKLKIPRQNEEVYLLIEYVKSNYKLFINGKLEKQVGEIGKNAADSVPKASLDHILLPDSQQIDIVIQVSNYHHSKGGIGFDISLAKGKALHDYVIRDKIITRVGISSFLGSLVLILLIIFMFFPKNKKPLYFSFAFIIMIGYNLLYMSGIKFIDDNLNWQIHVRLLYLLIILKPIVSLKVLDEYYGDICPKLVLQTTRVLTVIFVLADLFASIKFVSSMMAIWLIYLLLFGISVFYIHIKAIKRKIETAILFLVGTILVFSAFIYDALVFWRIIEPKITLLPLGYFILFLMATAGMFRNLAKAFETIVLQEKELQINLDRVCELNIGLNRVNDTKDEFLQRTSHELKSPLNGIIGMTEMMIEGETGHLSQAALHQLAIIGYSGKRLNNMINNVLDASKIKLNEIQIQPKPVNLSGVLDVVKKLSDKELRKRKIELSIEVGGGLGVSGDEDKINQIFHNLIDNAMRHSKCTKIIISQIASADMFTRILVKDNGIGIKEEEKNRIFEKYVQLEENSHASGSGLGLYISKGLCLIHGGDLSLIDPEDGKKGVGFLVKLKTSMEPAKKSLSEEIISENRHLLIKSDTIDLEEEKNEKVFEIWVVDDDAMNLYLIRQILKSYIIKTFVDPKEMLEDLKYKKPHLLLLDIFMPGINGYDVCREIRQMYSYFELPVIFLTGSSSTLDVVEGFKVGGNDYIIKPIEKNVLRARVRSQLSLSQINKRTIELRSYANKISDFKNTNDMINAIYELLEHDSSVCDIAVFETDKQIKRLHDGILDLNDYLESCDHEKELNIIQKDGRHHILIDLTTISDYRMLIEFIYEPDGIDIEYLKSAISQIKATKRNINKLLSQTKTIGIVNDINKKLVRVRFIKSLGNYCSLNIKSKKGGAVKEETLRISINAIRLYLGEETLVQVHKGYLVNKNYVRMLKKGSSKDKIEIDVDGEILPVGHTFRKNAEEIIKDISLGLVN